MARSHARLYTSIWADPDFVALSASAQRMFLFLVSQPDLEHSGVIALRPKRWTHSAAGLVIADVIRDLDMLGAARFVVIDEDTEELLIRSLMRWDGVWKQPNVAKSAATNIRTLTSAAIRAALRDELLRLDLTGVNKDTCNLHATLIEVLAEGSANQSANPSGNPSPNPSGRPSLRGMGSNTGSNHIDSPTPTTSPTSGPPSADAPGGETKPKPTRGTRIPDDFEVTPEMVAWARRECPGVDGKTQTELFIRYWKTKTGKDATKTDWVMTWERWMINARDRYGSNTNGHRSTTDDRVRGHIASGERLQSMFEAGEITL